MASIAFATGSISVGSNPLSSSLITQLVGKGKALEMLMTSSMIKAEEAKQLGLVNYVVEMEELIAIAEGIMKKISKNAPLAITKAIQAVNANFEDGVNGFKKEIELFGECFGTEDFIEGTTAFMEKRKAEFKGK